MKILFSPSEAKHRGDQKESVARSTIERNNYIFPELFDKRLELVSQYNRFIADASIEEKVKLFGTKKESLIEYYSENIFEKECMKVVQRYDGVAYDYLGYERLQTSAQKYIDENVLIFSNLFGPLLAGDKGLPDYKLKQGAKIADIAPEKFYHTHFTQALDKLLEEEEYLDLRAGFYNKFYKPSSPYTTLKFIKNGKVVSHWAKAYRGIVLRKIAQNSINSVDAFLEMEIENLALKEIIEKGIQREVIYDIATS